MRKHITFIVLSLFVLIFFACDLQLPVEIEVKKTQELEFRNVDHDLTQYITEMLSMADAGRIEGTEKIYILNITPQPQEETRLIYTSFNFDFKSDELNLGIDLDFDIDELLDEKIGDFLGTNFNAILDDQLDALIGAELQRLAAALEELESALASLTVLPNYATEIQPYVNPLTFDKFINLHNNLPPATLSTLSFNPSEFADLFNFEPSDFNTDAFGFNFDDFSFEDFDDFDGFSYEVDLNNIDKFELSDLTGEIDELFDNIPNGLGIDFSANLYISGSVFQTLSLEVNYNHGNFEPFLYTQAQITNNIDWTTHSYNGTGLPPGGILQTPINLEALRNLEVPVFKFSLDENVLTLNPDLSGLFDGLDPDQIFPPDTEIESATIIVTVKNSIITAIRDTIEDKIKTVVGDEIQRLIEEVEDMLSGEILIEAAAWLPVKLTVAAETEISISEFVDMDDLYTDGDLFGRSTVPSDDSFFSYIRDIEVVVKVSGNPLTGARLVIDDSANSGVEISIDLGSSITIPFSAEHIEMVNESKFAPEIMIVFDNDGVITIPSNFSLDSIKIKAAVGFVLEL